MNEVSDARRSSRCPSLLGALLLLSLGFALGCSNEDVASKLPIACSLSSDCKEGLVCALGRCRKPCMEARDCGNGGSCISDALSAVCQPLEEKERACSLQVDCTEPLACAGDYRCRNLCKEDSDCNVLGIHGRSCAMDDRGVLFCAEVLEVKAGRLVAKPPKGAVLVAGGPELPKSHDAIVDPSLREDGGTTGAMDAGAEAGAPRDAATGSDASADAATLHDSDSDIDIDAALPPDASNDAAAGPEAGATCPHGLGNCDSNPNDCETDFTLLTTCGACNVACASNHATVLCDPQLLQCVFQQSDAGVACATNYGDCDTKAATGCEADLLSESNHCGRCGRSCGGAVCSSGQCLHQVLIDAPGSVPSYQISIALAGDFVVYIQEDTAGSEIRSLKLPPPSVPGAGVLVQSFSQGALQPAGVTQDATHVYFATNQAPYTIYKKALDGVGTAQAVFDAVAGPAAPLLMTPTAFYFVSAGAWYTIARNAGPSTPVALPGLGGRGPIADPSYPIAGKAQIVANQLVWIEIVGGVVQVFRAPFGGGTPTLLDADIGSSRGTLASDGAFVYWNAYYAGEIRRVPVAGAASDVKRIATARGPVYPVVDDTYLYFTPENSATLKRVKKDGSDPFTVDDAVDDWSGYAGQPQVVADGFLYNLLNDTVAGNQGILVRNRLR